MLKIILLFVFFLLFGFPAAFAQDISLSTENESERNKSLSDSEKVLNLVYNILTQNDQDWDSSELSIMSLSEITNSNEILLTDSGMILQLSEQERQKLADSLSNILPI